MTAVEVYLFLPSGEKIEISDWDLTPAMGEFVTVDDTDYLVPAGGIRTVTNSAGECPRQLISLQKITTAPGGLVP